MMKYFPRCATPLVEREIDARTRLACSAEGCGFVFWDNPLDDLLGATESLFDNLEAIESEDPHLSEDESQRIQTS